MHWQELSAIIKSDKKPLKDYVVIDVRDEDWSGGHIKGSFNHPSERFLEEVDDLVAKTRHIPIVVFHCALSQARYFSIYFPIFFLLFKLIQPCIELQKRLEYVQLHLISPSF